MPDDIATPPVAPFMWASETRVRFRSGKPSGVWEVVSQTGPTVKVTKRGESGTFTAHCCWSEIKECKETEK